MVALDEEIARRENGRVVIRMGGVRVRWELTGLVSSDGFNVRGVFSATVRPLEKAAERILFEEAFFCGGVRVTTGQVAAHFLGKLETAARRECAKKDVQALMGEAGRAALSAELMEAGRAVAFGSGVELLPPLELELDSPTLRAQQEESRRSASQTERMSRAAGLFKQFKEIRGAAPELGAEKILQQLGAAGGEQAEMLRGLLMAAASEKEGTVTWAVSGPNLICISPGEKAAAQLLAAPQVLGPLRSVQKAAVAGKPRLLLGARSGVIVVDPQGAGAGEAYGDAGITSQLGFNAAAVCGGKIWATHGEAGVAAWEIGAGEKPAVVLRGEGVFSPRNLTVLDEERLVLSSENRVFEIGADGTMREVRGAGATIIAIVQDTPGSVITVHEDGELCQRDRGSLAVIGRARRSGRLTAAGALPWLGSVRLLLATEAGPVLAVGMEDELVGQYVSNHIGLRQVGAAVDRVAAVSADRQRIVLWPTWDGRTPAGEVHVAGMARHRVADIEC